MPIEGQVNNIADLNPAYPQADDPISQGDNHVRNIKKALKDTFPNIDGTVLPSDEELNQLVGKDFSGDISSLEGRVSKNEADIANNADGIQSNAGAITVVEGRVTKNELDIQNLNTVVGNHALRIDANENNIATNASNIAKNTGDIAKNTSDIAKNANNISINAGNIASNDSDIADLNSRVNALENAPAPGLIPHSLNEHTDVNITAPEEGFVLTYVGGNWIAAKPAGGIMDFVAQPSISGWTFALGRGGWSPNSATDSKNSYTLNVPNGYNFIFMGVSAYNGGTVFLNECKIDGKALGPLSYNSSITGDKNDTNNKYTIDWPEQPLSNGIRVENSFVLTFQKDYLGDGQAWVTGWFVEA